MADKILTGNRLSDGLVIFLGPDGGWTEDVNLARVTVNDVEDEALDELGQAAAKAQLVVDPYLIDIVEAEGKIIPVRYREKIRAFGPSIHPDYAKQDVPEHFHVGDDAPAFAASGLAG